MDERSIAILHSKTSEKEGEAMIIASDFSELFTGPTPVSQAMHWFADNKENIAQWIHEHTSLVVVTCNNQVITAYEAEELRF